MIYICEKKKSKKKTCIIVYMNYYMYVYTCIQLCSDSIFTTYIHSIINKQTWFNRIIVYNRVILNIHNSGHTNTFSFSLLNIHIAQKQNLNKYNIYI